MKISSPAIFFLLFVAGIILFAKHVHTKEASYKKSCGYKVGDIVYLKPDSTKAVIADTPMSLKTLFFGDTNVTYDVITIKNVSMNVNKNVIYKQEKPEENVY